MHRAPASRGHRADVCARWFTPRAAAAQLGVAESTAYYWLKRARQRPALALVRQVARAGSATRSRLAAPTFARLVRATEASSVITLRVAGTVRRRPAVDAGTRPPAAPRFVRATSTSSESATRSPARAACRCPARPPPLRFACARPRQVDTGDAPAPARLAHGEVWQEGVRPVSAQGRRVPSASNSLQPRSRARGLSRGSRHESAVPSHRSR